MTIGWQALIHVTLFALWLGAGLSGALVLWFGTRVAAGQVALVRAGLVLERMARTAFVLMLPAGLQLASDLSLIALPGLGAFGAWLLGLVWCAALWLRPPETGDNISRAARMAGRVFLVVVGVLLLGWAAIGSFGATASLPGWLAVKVALFGTALVLTLAGDVLHDRLLSLFHRRGVDAVGDGEIAPVLRATAPPMLTIQLLITLVLISAAHVGLGHAAARL